MSCRTRIRLLCSSLSLVVLGCGPPRPSQVDGGETSTGPGDLETGDDDESETSTDDEASTTDDAEGFVPPDESLPPTECDVFAQECAEGEKCVPYASTGGRWDAFKCVPVLGDAAWDEPCHYAGAVEATDDCDATGHCWDVMEVDGELLGTCAPFCLGTAADPECPPGYACLVGGSFTPGICIHTCDPLIQDCDAGLACYWANNNFNCIFTTRDIPVGEPCGFINDCAAGLACLTAEVMPDCAGTACCGAFCDLNLGDQPCIDALPGTACVSFFEQGMAPPGDEDVGVCILPP